MKIAICDDQEIQLELMEKYIKEWAIKNSVEIYIDKFNSYLNGKIMKNMMLYF